VFGSLHFPSDPSFVRSSIHHFIQTFNARFFSFHPSVPLRSESSITVPLFLTSSKQIRLFRHSRQLSFHSFICHLICHLLSPPVSCTDHCLNSSLHFTPTATPNTQLSTPSNPPLHSYLLLSRSLNVNPTNNLIGSERCRLWFTSLVWMSVCYDLYHFYY